MCNNYKIANVTFEKSHAKFHNHINHMTFRFEFVVQLFNCSKRFFDLKSSFRECKFNLLTDKMNHVSEHVHEKLIRLKNVSKNCEICIFVRKVNQHQVKKRKSLEKFSINNKIIEKRRLRVSRNQYECEFCKIHLCHHKRCWNEHINAI